MRFFWFLVLLAFVTGVGLFAWQNLGEVTMHFFDWQATASLAVVVAVVYLAGMQRLERPGRGATFHRPNRGFVPPRLTKVPTPCRVD